MTPETLSHTLNSLLPVVLLLVGIVVKYVPAFGKWPNKVIPYLNVVVSFLAQVFGPSVANAALPGVVGVAAVSVADALVNSLFHSIIARQLYEGFARPVLEKALKVQVAPAKKK